MMVGIWSSSSWYGAFRSVTVFVVLLSILNAPAAEVAEPCQPHHQSLTIPVHVHLLFAGSVPLFMRESSWTSVLQHSFLTHMHSVVRHPVMDFKHTPSIGSVLANRSHASFCSVIEYGYLYDMAIVDPNTAAILDHALSSILNVATSSFVDGTQVADKFYEILHQRGYIQLTNDNQQYSQQHCFFLVYNTVLVAPYYGYRSDKAGPTLTTALASSERFAFLDVGARPTLFAEKSGVTPGEVLMTSSGSKDEYAKTLHTIISDMLTPAVSTNMRQFPPESQIQFTLHVADVSEVVSEYGFGRSNSESNATSISLIDTNQFFKLLQSAFGHLSSQNKTLYMTTDLIKLEFNAKVAMAISRAFSHHGIDFILDSGQLYIDLIAKEPNYTGYYVDSSFVAHIPLYLFTSDDSSRAVHLSQTNNPRGTIIGKKAIFIVENRAQTSLSDGSCTTYEAVSLVLQLLCGLSKSSLAYLNVSSDTVPLILRDQIRRNVLVQELDWSERTAASKAEQLLNFEGIDSRFIPHEEGSIIQESRLDVDKKLNQLRAVWRQAASVLQGEGVAVATTQLIVACERLASKLHDEICNQRLSQEILLKAEADVEYVSAGKGNSISYGRFIFIPALVGVLITYIFLMKTAKARDHRSHGVIHEDVLSADSQRQPTQWFSTLLPLRELDKSKIS